MHVPYLPLKCWQGLKVDPKPQICLTEIQTLIISFESEFKGFWNTLVCSQLSPVCTHHFYVLHKCSSLS